MLEQANGTITGIEVKASASVKIQDFKGLSILAEFSGEKFNQGYLFYTGTEILPIKYNEFIFYALPIAMLIGEQNQPWASTSSH